MISTNSDPPIILKATSKEKGQSASRTAAPKSYLAKWIRSETLLLLREPIAVFFSLGFPLVILAFIGTAYANEEIADGVKFIDIMFPALVGTVAANTALMGMPAYFADLRSRQVLKRYRSLPMPRWVIGVAIEGALFSLLMLSVAIISIAIGVFYNIRATALSPLFIILLLAMVAWLSCMGLLLGSLPLQARAIQSVSAALFFFMFFGSGYAAPIDGLPGWLQAITKMNPLRWWFDGLVDVYLSEPLSTGTMIAIIATTVVAGFSIPLSLRLLGREQAG